VCSKPQYSGHAACTREPSNTYKQEVYKADKYDCDATSEACYVPTSYGTGYDNKGYSYHRDYPYPGPKDRFKKKMKAIGKAIKGLFVKIIGAISHKFHCAWDSFAKKWNTWCAKKKSDWMRFEDWANCNAQKWNDWWEHYHDLCRTRKELWDDAMREFHRQWHHYKQCKKQEYKDKKAKCHKEAPKPDYGNGNDYDETPDYQTNVNYYGVTPVEKSYAQENKYVAAYKQDDYNKECDTRKDHYSQKGKKY
jgi:hypothetical protein